MTTRTRIPNTIPVLAALLLLAVSALVALPAAAQSTLTCGPLDDGRIADVFYEGNAIFFEPIVRYEYESAVLRISGPCEDITKTFSPKEQIFFDLKEVERVLDGSYKWELRLMPAVDSGVRKELTASRGSGEEDDLWWSYWQKGLIPGGPSVDSAGFTVERGEIITPSAEEKVLEKTAASADGPSNLGGIALATAAAGTPVVDTTRHMSVDPEALEKATVINNDLVVYNSICVGFDCPTNPTFNADTIRLQENNLRIHAEDTSGGSFPTTDWRLEFNSNQNGGTNYFRVIDATANRNIMTLEGSAPSHSLYVDNGGRVGMGTSNPVVELHVADGDTPTLRLDQNTSSGFAAQVWDVAGNETSFFVRDATNGSTLPFRIRPGASSNSLVIDTDDDVGIGTLSPTAALHVQRTDGSAQIFVEENSGTDSQRVLMELENNGDVVMNLDDTSNAENWQFKVAGNEGVFQINSSEGAGNEMTLDGGTGNLTITGDFFSDTCNGSPCAPDYVFEADYPLMPLSEVAEFIAREKHLPNVPSAEELAGPINLSKMQMRLLEKIEELTLYTLEQESVIGELRARLEKLESDN